MAAKEDEINGRLDEFSAIANNPNMTPLQKQAALQAATARQQGQALAQGAAVVEGVKTAAKEVADGNPARLGTVTADVLMIYAGGKVVGRATQVADNDSFIRVSSSPPIVYGTKPQTFERTTYNIDADSYAGTGSSILYETQLGDLDSTGAPAARLTVKNVRNYTSDAEGNRRPLEAAPNALIPFIREAGCVAQQQGCNRMVLAGEDIINSKIQDRMSRMAGAMQTQEAGHYNGVPYPEHPVPYIRVTVPLDGTPHPLAPRQPKPTAPR